MGMGRTLGATTTLSPAVHLVRAACSNPTRVRRDIVSSIVSSIVSVHCVIPLRHRPTPVRARRGVPWTSAPARTATAEVRLHRVEQRAAVDDHQEGLRWFRFHRVVQVSLCGSGARGPGSGAGLRFVVVGGEGRWRGEPRRLPIVPPWCAKNGVRPVLRQRDGLRWGWRVGRDRRHGVFFRRVRSGGPAPCGKAMWCGHVDGVGT